MLKFVQVIVDPGETIKYLTVSVVLCYEFRGKEGLSFGGTTIIPFKDKFDKSLKLYSLMTNKPEEVEQREKEGGGSLGRERTERKRESCQ